MVVEILAFAKVEKANGGEFWPLPVVVVVGVSAVAMEARFLESQKNLLIGGFGVFGTSTC